LKSNPWRTLAVMFAVAVVAALCIGIRPSGIAAAPAPSPKASPTNPPTPFMALDQIPNGSWEVIEQTYATVAYSRMTLKEVGNSVTGTWYRDKNTVYALDGLRQGAHLALQIKATAKPDATVLGKMEADIDGIADMVGSITLGPIVISFQGAQHGRVPAPIDNNTTPAPDASPY
jgi:hypothetical protein